MCAGDKVEIRIPNQKPDDELKPVWDPEHSGTYLIKKLNPVLKYMDSQGTSNILKQGM